MNITLDTVKECFYDNQDVLKINFNGVTVWEKPNKGIMPVDMGLPSGTKWANMNIGATSEEEDGDFYAWGETETKSSYSIFTYKYQKQSGLTRKFTKYVTDSSSGTVDSITKLEPTDDVATVILGERYSIPTTEDYNELYTNTIRTTTTLNGKKVLKLTSRKNGSIIYMPYSGYKQNSTIKNVDNFHIITSELDTDDNSKCMIYTFGLLDTAENEDMRTYGHTVRAIYK